MLLPGSDKILLALMLQSPMLGIVRAGGIYRLVMFDELRINQDSLDIHGENWSLTLDDFIDNAKVFNHDANDHFVGLYPALLTHRSQSSWTCGPRGASRARASRENWKPSPRATATA